MEIMNQTIAGGLQESSKVKTDENQLFPYQIESISWLVQKKLALLALEMGLGKTVVSIKAADQINAKKILIICPAVARVNWLREFSTWSKHNRAFSVLVKRQDYPIPEQSVICSYDYAAQFPERLKSQWDVLILDEAHFLKSIEAKRTKAIYGKNGLVRNSNRVWALSGTPAPNHPGELWPILYTFGVTKLSYPDFIERYCHHYQTNHGLHITGTKLYRIPELKKTLSQIMLRRLKEDVMLELPPIHYSHITVEPGFVDIEIEPSFANYVFPEDKTSELFEKLKKEEQLLNSVFEAGSNYYEDYKIPYGGKNTIRLLEALATSVSTLRRYTGCQKIEPVVELIRSELEAGAYEKLVIFAIHQDVIEGLRVKLKDFRPVTLYGRTPPHKRQRRIDKFQKNPKCKIFIGNILAAGTAITLTAAHNVIFVEQDWVPGNNAQAAMRCHRIGQTKPVNVRFVAIDNTIDERICYLLKRKTKELSALFDQKDVALEETLL